MIHADITLAAALFGRGDLQRVSWGQIAALGQIVAKGGLYNRSQGQRHLLIVEVGLEGVLNVIGQRDRGAFPT